jgi:hypothetical protein
LPAGRGADGTAPGRRRDRATAPVDRLANLRRGHGVELGEIGTLAAGAKRLAPLADGERAQALRRLLAATSGDLALAERLLPFIGIIRGDLRGLPVVTNEDSLFVTESRLRKNTGTH